MNAFEKIYRIACFEIERLAVYKTVRAVHVAGRSYRKNYFFRIEHKEYYTKFLTEGTETTEKKTKENISVNS